MRFINSHRLLGLLLSCSLITVAGCSAVKTPEAAIGSSTESRELTENPYLKLSVRVPAAARETMQRARGYYQQQQFAAAETELQQITGQWPEFSGAWLNLGIVYRSQQQTKQAEASLRKAVAVNALNVFAWNELGALLRDAGRFEESREAYSQALQHWPDYPQAHRNLGILLDLYLQKPEQALRHYRKAQLLQGDKPDKKLAGWIVDLERRL